MVARLFRLLLSLKFCCCFHTLAKIQLRVQIIKTIAWHFALSMLIKCDRNSYIMTEKLQSRRKSMKL